MEVRLIRHATLLVSIVGATILVDPMLDPTGARDAVAGTANDRRNPLVGLPEPAEAIAAAADAVLVSHLHGDHLDQTAVALLRERDGLPVGGQEADVAALRERGLAGAIATTRDTELLPGVRVTRTDGRHGTGEIGRRMGPVSGFVLHAEGEPVLYVAGDTIWCAEVAAALAGHAPDVVVLNAGAAQFTEGDPITMTPADVLAVAGAAPAADVIAVHMDAVNHCLSTRAHLRADAGGRVLVPEDGAVAWPPPEPG